MEESDKRRLRANYVQLVSNLHPEDVIDYLYQERVLTGEDMERIMAEPVRAKKVRILLSTIPLRKKDALKKLLVALNENGYCELADELQGTDGVDGLEEAYDETEESKDPLHNLTVLKEKILEQADFVQAMQMDVKRVRRENSCTEMINNLEQEKSQKHKLVKELCTAAKHELGLSGLRIDDESHQSGVDYSSASLPNQSNNSPDNPQHHTTGHRTLKCLVVGDGASGKTCLVYRHIYNKFRSSYKPTVFDNYTFQSTVLRNNVTTEVEVSLWDTAGQEDYDEIRVLTYEDADVVLLLFSTISYKTLDNVLKKWLPEIRSHLPTVPCILVGTKADPDAVNQAMEQQQAIITSEKACNIAEKCGFYGTRAFMTSALTGQGVKELMDYMAQAGLEYRYRSKGAKTGHSQKQRCTVS